AKEAAIGSLLGWLGRLGSDGARKIEIGYLSNNGAGIGGGPVDKDCHGEFVVNLPGNVGDKSLPGAAVSHGPGLRCTAKCPAKSVGVGLAVIEPHRRPHLFETGFLEELFGVEGSVPLRQIQDGEIEASVGGPVERWRNILLVS